MPTQKRLWLDEEKLYWLLGTSVRKIANFTFSPSLFACHVKLERGKSREERSKEEILHL